MRVQLVLGLGFGDEGKGTVVDYLARRAPAPPLVVRWNGGPQAAHHVVDDDGRVHCCSQLGAASLVPGARTHLAGDMAVDLHALGVELAQFGDPSMRERVTIDPRCALVAPWHASLNLIREALRGAGRHGTTGRGVAEAKLGPVRLFAGELGAGFDAERRIRELRGALLARAAALVDDTPAAESDRDRARDLLARAHERDLLDAFLAAARSRVELTDRAPRAEHVILESAQGALLDREHGFFPHVTPSRITLRAARDAARALGLAAPIETWGVLRAYHTRHGEGPFPSDDRALAARLPELHNRSDGPAGRFRVGWFDAVLARHALAFAGPIDRLAVTCLDRVAALPDRAIVTAWREPHGDIEAAVTTATPIVEHVDDVARAIEAALGRPIDLASLGPRAADKVARMA